MSKKIAILVFDGISAFHLSVPYTVFGEDRSDLGIPSSEVFLCTLKPGTIRTSMGFEKRVDRGLESIDQADMVIIPSWKEIQSPVPSPLVDALSTAHSHGTVVVGLCLGAFAVAGAGLLAGRAATTHWNWAQVFAERFPEVLLDPKVLYIDHGDVVTSAGTAAALDCCLHLLRKDFGAERTNRLAKRLIVPPHRQGSQAQYVEQPQQANAGADRISSTLFWARQHLSEAIDIEALAEHAAMSRRTFTRHMRKATGMSVVQWLTAQRLFLAQRLLETTDLSVEQVATDAGFVTSLSLRLAFIKALNTSPRRYRQEFRGSTILET
ncbi:MAG: helix-turn-helix domain-containing protein [Deltaproteobacteria bacterium]|nr:helix-turn-helix domain-containing protein [Deltaproteobacteria bacterium]